MGAESPFIDLRRLADWFSTSPTRPSLHVERIVSRLGATAIPLLGREITSANPHRRDAARAALGRLASNGDLRVRVLAELRAIVDDASACCDDAAKVCALGLLAELGEKRVARFANPSAIQHSSAIALAAQLDTAADVAAAVELMVAQLADDDLVQLVAIMAEAAPVAAHRVADELCVRLDIDAELRERVAEVALLGAPPPIAASKPTRPTHAHVMIDRDSRVVVVAIRKVSGERRWRRWAVLIANQRIEDCLHEDLSGDVDATALVDKLIDDGYRVASTELERATSLVAAAARVTGDALPSPYYLGRDLLELGDAHVSRARTRRELTAAAIGRAVELIADGDLARAKLLLARCDESADSAAAMAACLLGQGRADDAVPHLLRACELEPSWPLHHWNLAAAYHAIGDAALCHQALRRFVATSAAPSALAGDPDQQPRLASANRMIAELERVAKLVGRRLRQSKTKK
jgi:tetratricopeptide (TPR) repeat protein